MASAYKQYDGETSGHCPYRGSEITTHELCSIQSATLPGSLNAHPAAQLDRELTAQCIDNEKVVDFQEENMFDFVYVARTFIYWAAN